MEMNIHNPVQHKIHPNDALYKNKIKLCDPPQANTSSTCVLNENGGISIKILNCDLDMANIISITFLKEVGWSLNSSLAFSGLWHGILEMTSNTLRMDLTTDDDLAIHNP